MARTTRLRIIRIRDLEDFGGCLSASLVTLTTLIVRSITEMFRDAPSPTNGIPLKGGPWEFDERIVGRRHDQDVRNWRTPGRGAN